MQNNSHPHYRGKRVLSDIETSLINYSEHIINLFISHANFDDFNNLEVLDFGAGQGTLAKIWKNQTGNIPVCAELDPNLLSRLEGEGFPAHKFMSSIKTRFDFVYTSNVLEHIENDVGALRDIAEKMKVSGLLAIYVPAFPLLFSQLDRNVGHFRRYTMDEIVEKLEAAGFQIVLKEYSDSVGFLATLILKYGGFPFTPNERTLRWMKFYDQVVVPISIFLDNMGLKYLFGKNLLIVARLQN